MKLLSILAISLLLYDNLFAQAPRQERRAENLFTIGVIDCPVKLDGINHLLSQGGYPALVNNVATISFGIATESRKDQRFSADINYAYSHIDKGKSEAYATAIGFHSARIGLGYEAAERKALSLVLQPGLSIIQMHVHCYSELTDTSSLGNYLLAGPTDQKSFSIAQPCLDLRLTLNWRMRQDFLLQAIGGYQVHFGRPGADHFRGSFGNVPDTRLAGFYFGVRVGFHLHRAAD